MRTHTNITDPEHRAVLASALLAYRKIMHKKRFHPFTDFVFKTRVIGNMTRVSNYDYRWYFATSNNIERRISEVRYDNRVIIP